MKDAQSTRLKRAPFDRLSQDTTKALHEQRRQLDHLTRIDRQGRLHLHEPSLRRLLHGHMRPEHVDSFVAGIKTLPDASVIGAAKDASAAATMRPLSWRELIAQIEQTPLAAARPANAVTDEEFESIVVSASSPAQLRTALQSRYPQLPDFMFHEPTLQRVGQDINARLLNPLAAADATTSARSLEDIWNQFWPCVVASVGIWTAVALITIIVAIGLMAIYSGGVALPALMITVKEIAGPTLILMGLSTLHCALKALGINITINIG